MKTKQQDTKAQRMGKLLLVGLIAGVVVAAITLAVVALTPGPPPLTAQQKADALQVQASERQAAAEQVIHNTKALKVTAGALTLRKIMRNPASFTLASAIMMKDGSVCYDYRSQNGFGGMNEDQAVMTPKGRVDTDSDVYRKYCHGKGEEFVEAAQ
jgi:hypothetical protein